MVLGIFKIAFRLRDRHVFMWQSGKISHVFNTLTLKQISWQMKTFFKKLEDCLLVETTEIENTSFPFKTALSETNVETNRMATTKITKKGVLLVPTLYFWKFFSSFRTSWKELTWCTSNPNVHIRIFRYRSSLILGCFFAVSILKHS